MPKIEVLAEPPLIGREKEIEELDALLNCAVEGKGKTVFISGEAGSGKTRLVTEFLKRAKKQGAFAVLTGWCLSNAAIPYFPFLEAFRKYFSTECETKEVETNIWLRGGIETEGFRHPQTMTPQIWKDQTFTAVANTLTSISAKYPVIFFIDDLHWADSASLALIHYLANTVNSAKVLIIATFRTEQLAGDSESRPQPLVETLRLMRRQDLIKEINVPSLDEISVSKLAKSMLGGDLQQELARKLNEESQGNPLFIVESIRMLYERKGLVHKHDEWRLNSAAIEIPPKIKDIFLQRLDLLSRDQRNVLVVASVIGENFDPSLLAAVLGQDCIEIIKTLDAVARNTSLVRCEGELYRFDHARTRDTIYNDVSPALKRKYHANVAEKLESMSKEDNFSFSDLAYQYAQAGNKTKAVKYALAAGQSALAKWSNVEAVKHFTFVVEAVGQNPEYGPEIVTAIEGMGDANYANDNFAQAVNIFEQLADTQNGAPKLRALRKAIRAASYQGDISKQKALIQKAEAIAGADRLEAGRILNEKGTVVGGENDWVTALKLMEEALLVFEEEYAPADIASILPLIGYVAATLGHLEMGVATALRSIVLRNELGDVRSQIEAHAYAGGTFQACTLDEISNRMLAKAIELNEHHKIWDYIRVIPAYVWWSIGLIGVDPADSISKVLKALEYSEKTDSRLYTGAMYGVLVIAHAIAEDKANTDKYFEKLMSLPKHILSNGPTQVYLGPATGAYHTTNKEFEKANQYFNQSLAVGKLFFPNPFFEASTRQLFAWALNKQGRIEEAKSQLEQSQKLIEISRKRFSSVNIHSSIMMFTRPEVNQTFPIRLDLVNVSTSEGSLVTVENLKLPGFKIIDISPNCFIQNDRIKFKKSRIAAFEVETIRLTVQATKPGEFSLSPTVTYLDDLGETKTKSISKISPKITHENNNRAIISHIPQPVKIVVHPRPLPEPQDQKTDITEFSKFEFETESAKKALDFLLSSFVQDYMNRRLPLEWSGWRTMMDIVKNAKIPKRTVYSSNRRNGIAITELSHRGLVEIRVFPGERGRGGRIQKVRVCHEKETITRLIDERTMKSEKKQ